MRARPAAEPLRVQPRDREPGVSGRAAAGEVLGTVQTEAILEVLAEPILLIGTDFRVQYLNRAARELFSCPPPASGPVWCHQLSHHRETPCSGSGHPCPMAEVLGTGRSVCVLHEHYAGDGTRRVVEIVASPLRDERGAVCGIVESQRDVTARQEANDRVRRYAVELERSNRLKDLFSDIMRHDLLGPAGVIRGTASLVLHDEADAARRRDLELILDSSRRMIELIEGAAALTRLEAQERLPLEPTDIGALVGDVVRGCAADAGAKRMRLTVAGDGAGPVPANPLLASVFTNLVGNAVKYAPAGTEVRIVLERVDGGCLVSVADRGEGVPDDAKEDIFTRFTRLHKGRVKGTGLGLAIARRVVELHGGRIWVEDAPGGGSTFRVWISAAPESAGAASRGRCAAARAPACAP